MIAMLNVEQEKPTITLHMGRLFTMLNGEQENPSITLYGVIEVD